MSIRTMIRQCVRCRRMYTYNPSVGDLGMVCKLCFRTQAMTIPISQLTGQGGCK